MSGRARSAICRPLTAAAGSRSNVPVDAMHRNADEAITVLKAMASHNRLLLLCRLSERECSVGELAQVLDLAQSVVSQHLSLLRRDGVVSARRDAQSIFYRISDARVQVLMSTMFTLFCVDE